MTTETETVTDGTIITYPTAANFDTSLLRFAYFPMVISGSLIGTISVAYRLTGEGESTAMQFAFAFCQEYQVERHGRMMQINRRDTFIRKLGRQIATSRLLSNRSGAQEDTHIMMIGDVHPFDVLHDIFNQENSFGWQSVTHDYTPAYRAMSYHEAITFDMVTNGKTFVRRWEDQDLKNLYRATTSLFQQFKEGLVPYLLSYSQAGTDIDSGSVSGEECMVSNSIDIEAPSDLIN